MRISPAQSAQIRALAIDMIGDDAIVTLCGSRIDNNKRGGDLDLLIEYPYPIENPAWQAAQLSAKISRLMSGRRIDIILSAPNLMSLPIHKHAKLTGRQI